MHVRCIMGITSSDVGTAFPHGLISECWGCGGWKHLAARPEWAAQNLRAMKEAVQAEMETQVQSSRAGIRSKLRVFATFCEQRFGFDTGLWLIGHEYEPFVGYPAAAMRNFFTDRASDRDNISSSHWEGQWGAVQAWHSLRGLWGPSDLDNVSALYNGLMKKMGRAGKAIVTPVLPVRGAAALAVVNLYAQRLAAERRRHGPYGARTYFALRALFWFVYGFFGIARGGDARAVRLRDITFLADPRTGQRWAVKITLFVSKTDQFGRTKTQTFPVSSRTGVRFVDIFYDIKLTLRGMGFSPDDRVLVQCPRGAQWGPSRVPLSARTDVLRVLIRDSLVQVSALPENRHTGWALEIQRARIDNRKFGTASLRRGGETYATERGLQKEQIMRHGRWASDTIHAYDEQPAHVAMAVPAQL